MNAYPAADGDGFNLTLRHLHSTYSTEIVMLNLVEVGWLMSIIHNNVLRTRLILAGIGLL